MALIGPLFITVACAQQDPTQQVQEFNYHIDNLGDATCEMSTTMTQRQWLNFKQGQLYNDPGVARRNLQRSMSAYVIEDFKRDIDEMNRTVKMSLKLRAMATYKGNGHWELKLDSKNPQITKLTDNSFMMTSNVDYGGTLVQQVFKVFLPAGAGNVQQTTDSFNKTIFTYSNGGGITAMLTWNNILGILLILGAGVVFYLNYKKNNNRSLSKILVHAPTANPVEKTNQNSI